MRRVFLTVSGLSLVLFLLAGCARQEAPVTPAAGLCRVVLQTDWFPQAEHGGFYQALAKGYYREAGLDVEIRPGGPGMAIKLDVAKGVADFGMYRSDDIIVAASRGMPLMIVGAVLQHDPEGLLVHEASPVRTLADLSGHSVIAPPSMTWIPYVQKKYGIKFDLRPLTYSVTAFLADKETIQQCMMTSEPFFARQHGAKVRVIRIADSGYDPYHTIMCRRELVRTNPELIRAFLAASIRGWHDYLENDPAPAFDLIRKRNTQMSLAQLTFSRGELIAHALVTGDAAHGEEIGKITLARIAQQIATLSEFKILEKPVTAESVANPAFLPSAGLR